jgi:nucleoside-diphosphate-sugar epimerase
VKIIVTGATGCLGRNVAETFHGDGMEVVATGRSTTIGAELRNRGVDFRTADIRDPAQLDRVLSPADCLVHCAGRSGDWGTYRDFHETNVIGTRNVVDACRRHGLTKIIFVSTPSIYYTGKDRYDVSESDPLPDKQRTHYARTKLIAESDLLQSPQSDYKAMVFRPRAVYGPHDRTFVPRILRLAKKKHLPLINDGRALTDITYVGNFVDAVKRSLEAPDRAWNQAYNLSNGEPITMREWFSQVLAIFGRPFRPKNVPEPVAKAIALSMELLGHLPFGPKKPAMTRFSVGYMARSMTMAIDKARENLGYIPRIGNREGFGKCAEWYGSKGAG